MTGRLNFHLRTLDERPCTEHSGRLCLQAEQTKYEARIVGLQRAKQEAVAKAEAQCQKAAGLQQELEKLTVEKTRYTWCTIALRRA